MNKLRPFFLSVLIATGAVLAAGFLASNAQAAGAARAADAPIQPAKEMP